MHSSEMGRSGTIQMLRWFTYAGLLIPTLLFAGAAWKDRAVYWTPPRTMAPKWSRWFMSKPSICLPVMKSS